MICVGTVCRCEGIRDLFALLQFKRDLVLPFVIPMKENNQRLKLSGDVIHTVLWFGFLLNLLNSTAFNTDWKHAYRDVSIGKLHIKEIEINFKYKHVT